MQVTVYGINYTGAHFRGMADPVDSRDVKVTLVGEEANICQYITSNFAYGEKFTSLDELIEAYQQASVYDSAGDEHEDDEQEEVQAVSFLDGCGGVFVIEGDKEMDLTQLAGAEIEWFNENNDTVDTKDHKFVDLGVVNVDAFIDPHNHVNELVTQLYLKGELPKREGEDNSIREMMNKVRGTDTPE